MQNFVRPLLLRHSDEELEDNLLRAIEAPVALVRVADWHAFRSGSMQVPPGAICIADPFGISGRGDGISEDFRDTVHQHPGLIVIAAFRIEPEDASLINELYQWGVADILDLQRENSPAAVARRVDEVRRVWVERLLSRVLGQAAITSRARAMLGLAAEVAAAGGGVQELSERLRLNARTVQRWCERIGLPHPRRVMVWSKLMLVASVLDEPKRRSVEAVAHACGYVSAATLKQTLKKFVGMGPAALRKNGALETVATLFRAEIRQHRDRMTHPPDFTWLN